MDEELEKQMQNELDENAAIYNGLQDQMNEQIEQQKDALEQYKEDQTKIQQEQTDFTIQQIEQQKEQAKKDYQKEQSGAYVDWQKQSNRYGVNAEKMAGNGLAGTGFSESSQVQMWNTYQMRVATAKESLNRTMETFNNAITEARLQNNAALAQLAWEVLQKQLALQMDAFQFNTNLIMEQQTVNRGIEDKYYNRNLAERDFNLGQQNEKYDRLVTLITNTGYEPTDEELEAAGMTRSEYEAYKKLYTDGQNSGGSYSGGGSGGGDKTIFDLFEVDKDSVLALGMGELTNDDLARLISEGKVNYRIENGKIFFDPLKVTETLADYNIDPKSVAKLGMGQLTVDQLWELVESGEIGFYEKDGITYFYKTVQEKKGSML